jgi:hypothetical protein
MASMIGRMHHLILDCPDPLALATFYSGLFGRPKADRWAPHRRRDLVCQRRLARSRRAADDNESGKISHLASYSQEALDTCTG